MIGLFPSGIGPIPDDAEKEGGSERSVETSLMMGRESACLMLDSISAAPLLIASRGPKKWRARAEAMASEATAMVRGDEEDLESSLVAAVLRRLVAEGGGGGLARGNDDIR